ncbi:unnamed protein product [Polarella glacialis]|uniref:Uncharacterized protein n=1 Tax=Polarella glacialis TaxID=89957 RepID=A0A813EV26_POLGL|nr:unnamed protein product [Polarella glacialis]CAE8682058.1 unnamed protein product [Polarella glacialis]|eukprot:CAMPEP_0115083988 /NCGR_PEP_ID=MMETSP0227-20121206/20953_1 /TAXON_ID=89957 /ORGANISM="Polarella glacialis, Strain CCMP 1383" /LENGTH=173 /DNA_ID=CAMNT_0002472631 /DNA_START=87 /DNA_END=608 /DNA_ORIENTATION=-
MAATHCLMQQGSKGPMRDLDYINPRPPRQSSALPPEVRALLMGKKSRSSSEPPPEVSLENKAMYLGAANATPKVGQSGAGTNWQNPNGHAFVKRGSGLPNSYRPPHRSHSAGLAGAAMLGGGKGSGGYAERRPFSREVGGSPARGDAAGGRPPMPKARIGLSDAGYASQKRLA